MGMPEWWRRRRFGIFVHANVATVPAWSPIGQYADWYWSHLGADLEDVLLHPQPLVEVVAHHQERWGFVEHFDDFTPLLTFEDFDPAAWAELVVQAGAGYTVFVSKHHDGWCWWDAPGTDRTLTSNGPKRDVMREYADACRARDIVFGAYYSLLDWGDRRFPDSAYVDEVLHPHAADLVERFGAKILWGDGHWGHGPDHWRTEQLLHRLRTIDPELVINDRWWADPDRTPDASPRPFTVFEYDTPAGILSSPWELCRGIGHSFCHNRAEREEHHLTGFEIVALFTEVLAKGGNLLLNVGPAVDGTIPDLQAAPLRAAGEWIRRYDWLARDCVPWKVWGDDKVRYLVHDGGVFAVDVGGGHHLAGIDPRHHRVVAVEAVTDGPVGTPVDFRHDRDGVHLEHPRHARSRRERGASDVAVYRVHLREVEAPIELFDPTPAAPIDLGPIIAGAAAGDIVQLGDGVYRGPVTVPPGVVLRGFGSGRTVIDGGGEPAVELERNARLEHLSVTGAPPRLAWFPVEAVAMSGDFSTVVGCEIDGHVIATGDGVTVRATTALGVVAAGQRAIVSRCRFRGMRWDTGVHLVGGEGHEVDSCDLRDHLCAIRATDATGVIVRGNTIQGRWWGVHLERCERAHVHGNTVHHTMRAVDVDGGVASLIDGNAVFDGDTGCVAQNGTAAVQVSGNHWERCRVGMLAWDVTGLHHQDNHCVALHDPEHSIQIGP